MLKAETRLKDKDLMLLTTKMRNECIYLTITQCLRVIGVLLVTSIALLLAYQQKTIFAYQDKIANMSTETRELKMNAEKLSVQVESLDADLTRANQLNKDLIESYNTLNDELKKAVKSNKSYKKELAEYKEREDLLNKYEYAIYYGGERTDLTYDQIKYGEDLMEAKGYDPDLLFSIIMVESRANEKCTSTVSTAKGYGQFLDGTAKFVYEDRLKLGTFQPSYSLNGKTNILMMSSYLDYLIKKNSTLTGVIRNYRGKSDVSRYMAEMNKFSSVSNMVANIY